MKSNSFLILEVIILLLVSACITQEPATLEDTLWKLDLYANQKGNLVSLLPDTEITAQFSGGVLSGKGNCYDYSGNYEVNGNTISIRNIEMVLGDCWPSSQDSDYWMALSSVRSYEIHGNILEMINAEGKVISIYSTKD